MQQNPQNPTKILYICAQDYQGYDTYDSVLVVADSEEEALQLCSAKIYKNPLVSKIGTTDLYAESQELMDSFNAGWCIPQQFYNRNKQNTATTFL